MTDLAVRRLEPSDRDEGQWMQRAIRSLRHAWDEERDRVPAENRSAAIEAFTAEFDEWFDRERAHRVFWAAATPTDTDPDAAVGMVNLLLFDRMPVAGAPSGGWGYLANMYVRPARRDDGIGAQLLDALFEWADDEGLERVVLKPSERSIPFYERAGCTPATLLRLRQRGEPQTQNSLPSGSA